MSFISDFSVNKRSRITTFHVAVVSLSLLLTFAAWQFSKYQIETRTGQRFDASTERAIGLITDRMTKYEDALWAGVATIGSHNDDISYADWATFAQTLRVGQKYPGINGIGVIHFQTRQTIADYMTTQRQERPDFNVYPPHDQADKMPITFITPESANVAAIGLDVAHEANRRSAALASRDTGTAQITGPIVLVQDAGHTAGFLFYAPFYKGGMPQTLAARQDGILGAVYAPFVVHKLMEGLLAKDLREIRFSIRDGSTDIYNEHTMDDAATDPDPMHGKQVMLNVYGRTWVLDIRSDLTFRTANTYAQPTIVLVSGLLVEALIISLLVLMSRANHQAISYAQEVTAKLRKKSDALTAANRDLSRKNDELEQFTYVASHDLKTPIRGISGLVEMIEEDLADYFLAPTANPDVSRNLTHIQERASRMTELTSGILQIFTFDPTEMDAKPVFLNEVVAALRSDFDLREEQLTLFSDVLAIQYDIFNFRRVLENLVGNAVKYHDRIEPLKITITAKSIQNRCQISVKDNGPGIDPMYHSKVFDLFQTLRIGGAPESTGIGLAIVKKSVERHQSTVKLTSTLGEGAEFSFDWPHQTQTSTDTATQEAA